MAVFTHTLSDSLSNELNKRSPLRRASESIRSRYSRSSLGHRRRTLTAACASNTRYRGMLNLLSHFHAGAGPQADTVCRAAPVRTFNTSRALKRPNDSSTIDFAFMPSQETLSFAPGSVYTNAINVPIVPTNFRTSLASQPAVSAAAVDNVMPDISTVSMAAPGQVSLMNETDFGSTHEGREMDVYKIVEAVSRKVDEVKQTAEEEVGFMKQLVSEFLDAGRRTA